MKIKDERTKDRVRFGDLFDGDVFDANGSPAIKTADGRAVVLTDGKFVERKANDLVALLDAELVVFA